MENMDFNWVSFLFHNLKYTSIHTSHTHIHLQIHTYVYRYTYIHKHTFTLIHNMVKLGVYEGKTQS